MVSILTTIIILVRY